MWLVPQLTAFHQSQAEKSIPLGNTFGFRQLREQRLEKCGLCPITLHFSRPLIGGRQATVVQQPLIHLVSRQGPQNVPYAPLTPESHCRTISKSEGHTQQFYLSCDKRIQVQVQKRNRNHLKKMFCWFAILFPN